jgi:hypothetical protein
VPTPLSLDPATVDSQTEAPWRLGQLLEREGKLYRYVKLMDAVAGANGMLAELASTSDWLVTVDRAGGSAVVSGSIRSPVGLLVGVLTPGRFGFLQVSGFHPAARDAANALTALQKFTAHATTDGDIGIPSAFTQVMGGYALAAASGGVVPVMARFL